MLKYKDITPIVVSWNRADRLKKCLESLDNCPKIIVWDNDSKTEEKNKMINMEKEIRPDQVCPRSTPNFMPLSHWLILGLVILKNGT